MLKTIPPEEISYFLYIEDSEKIKWGKVFMECPAFGGTQTRLPHKELSYGSPKGEHSKISFQTYFGRSHTEFRRECFCDHKTQE